MKTQTKTNSVVESIPKFEPPQEKFAPSGINITHYKCLKNTVDGSIFYGELAYIKKENNQLILSNSEAYATEVWPLDDEKRAEVFKAVRHGQGLMIYNGQRNADGVLSKYEGGWDRDRKNGQGFAVFADGATFQGTFKFDKIDGNGVFNWAQGHTYTGAFRDGQMEGKGRFVHANGTEMQGNFKRNQFQSEKCFVNPLDDIQTQKRTEQRLLKDVLISKEEQEKRDAITLFKVHSDEDCANAIIATQERGRIPLFIRTPLCAINKAELSAKIVDLFDLDETTIEINLRELYIDALGKPSVFKLDQKAQIGSKVRKALQTNSLLLLNFDDYVEPIVQKTIATPEKPRQVTPTKKPPAPANAKGVAPPKPAPVVEEKVPEPVCTQSEVRQPVFAANFDPNLTEYLGTDSFPAQLWSPQTYVGRKDFYQATGAISVTDDSIISMGEGDSFCQTMNSKANLVVWSTFVFKNNQPSMIAANLHVQKIMQQQEDELLKVDTPEKEQHETDLYDENHISEALILEKVEKRFGKALPLHRMDVILLMDQSRKHASIEQFEPLDSFN